MTKRIDSNEVAVVTGSKYIVPFACHAPLTLGSGWARGRG
jgi:hypothetical protein